MEVAKLLWTGGWDSTYRLLMLVRVRKQPVQPYYIIDHDRLSLPNEIRAMYGIREAIFERWPETRKLIRPTVFRALADIAPDPEITRLYEVVKRDFLERFGAVLGSQNDWLARFAEQQGLDGLEMGLHRADSRGGPFYHYLLDDLVIEGDTIRLGDNVRGGPALFRRFHFPLMFVDKPEMRENARQLGFLDLLERTWFCFTPRSGKPCGRCNPCLYTMKQGLPQRVPPLRRIWFYLVRQPRRALQKTEWVRRMVRRLRGGRIAGKTPSHLAP